MATTIYTDDTLAAFAIGARTDDAGAAVDDVSAEEARLINQILTPGVLEPADGWLVAERGAGANMSVDVGSGVAKTDLAVVQGNIAGQGRYLVRGELGTVNVTVPAAHTSLARTDEVYLVVADAPYDSGSLSLPRIGYRQGDAGGGAPGPDAAWDAYLLLATISVPANDTTIADAQITDERAFAALADGLVSGASLDDDSVTAAKIADGVLPEEVDGSVEVASVALTTSLATVATVNLTIPASWASWKCVAYATYAIASGASNPINYETVIRIDGTDQQVKAVNTATSIQGDGAVGGRRTGLTTTGSRSVILRARYQGNASVIQDIFLYARAVRTG